MSRSKIVRLLLGVGFVLALGGCSTLNAPSIERVLAGIPAKNLGNYDFKPVSTLEDRVVAAPDFVLKYLREMDKTDAYTSYQPTDAEKGQVSSYLSLLPPGYVSTLRERLIGIYFINNWTGSGLADYVLGDNRKLYAILIVNPETMRHDISEWMTYRESTLFQAPGGHVNDLGVMIDCGTKYSGLMYLLLHETSHIMDYVHHYTPYVEESLRQLGLGSGETDFTKGVWTTYDKPLPQFDFSSRKSIAYYGLGQPLPRSKAADLYSALKASPFASLYGSQNWAEDFAESCAWYYFTTKLDQPYRLLISANGGAAAVIEPTQSPLFQQRAGFLPVN